MTFSTGMEWTDPEGTQHEVCLDTTEPPLMLDREDLRYLWRCSCGIEGQWEDVIVSTLTLKAHLDATRLHACMCPSCLSALQDAVTEIDGQAD